MANPGGKGTVTPYVAVKGADAFVDFVVATFAAEELGRVRNEDGTVGHAEVRVGDSVIMAFDAHPDWPDTPALLSVYLDDVDATVARAVAAGAEVITPVETSRIVGDRGGRIRDPFGNVWWLITHLEDVDADTMRDRFADPAEVAIMRRFQETFAAEMAARTGQLR